MVAYKNVVIIDAELKNSMLLSINTNFVIISFHYYIVSFGSIIISLILSTSTSNKYTKVLI